MLILSVDTSTPVLSAAVVRVERDASEMREAAHGDAVVTTLAAQTVEADQRHGEATPVLVQQVLATAGVNPRDLDSVVVGVGPGPFTGLRVGIVTGLVIAKVAGAQAIGVCSLDGVNLAAITPAQTPETPETSPADPVAVLTDARRREVYWATYADGRRISGPHVDYPHVVVDRLRDAGSSRVTGPGAEKYRAVFEDAGFRIVDVAGPSAENLAAHSLDASKVLATTPLYLRRPDAAEPKTAKAVTA